MSEYSRYLFVERAALFVALFGAITAAFFAGVAAGAMVALSAPK